MHYWDGNGGFGWGGWLVMVTMMVIFWGALAWAVVTLARHYSSAREPAMRATQPYALGVLDDRYARGEIDDDEYNHRRDLLRGGEG